MDEPRWREGLNPAQLSAVEHDGGPLLVVAGAGTGKTRTLASRVARLLDAGTDPDRVLLLTFSRRAAREMLGRAEQLTDRRDAGRVWGGTFHSVGHRLLREHGRAVGLPERLSVLDQGDATELMGVVRADLGVAERGQRFPKKETLLDIYGRVVNSQRPLREVVRDHFPWCDADLDGVAAAFRGYAEHKRVRGLLDYDDLLLYWRALVQGSPVADRLATRFDHVLVDEFQDTNLLQSDIVAGLRPGGDGLFVVGDDAQAIYGFRAASSGTMAAFPSRFAGTTIVRLEENYRSVQPILDVANDLLAGSVGVLTATLRAARQRPASSRPVLATARDASAEASWVCERLLEHRELGVPLREQAVLFRAGHHSSHLELELGRRRIPFVKYGGLTFLEAAHVKDLLGFLRLLENPSDELAWQRVLGLLEGVGPGTARTIVAALGLPNPEALTVLVDSPPEVPPRARADLDRLRELFRSCLEHPAAGAPAVEIELVRTGARSFFERRYAHATARLADLEQLQEMASGAGSRSQFLADLTIDPPSRTSELAGPPLLDDDFVVLSTIHSAKGGEWTAVYVIHASDGNIPSDMALSTREGLEEERRLFYVALTRARDHLYVSHPQRFYDRRHGLDDRHALGQPSRFVHDVGHRFDRPAPAQVDILDGAPPVDGPDLVAAQLAALWE